MVVEENNPKEVDLKNAKDIDITDSNVKITINPGESQSTNAAPKETDYWSLVLIVVIALAIAAYIFLPWVRTLVNGTE
jgi:hypothetical protein